MHIPRLDSFTTATVWIAALFMAVNEGLLRSGPIQTAMPGAGLTGLWSFFPLAILMAGFLVGLVRQAYVPSHGGASPPHPQAAAKPSMADEPLLPRESREYLSEALTARFVKLVQGRATDLKVEAFLRPHVGKWIRLEGELVSTTYLDGAISVSISPGGQGYVTVKFEHRWIDELAHFDKDETVRCEALIHAHPIYGLRLGRAELA